jgi:hypothetical protein
MPSESKESEEEKEDVWGVEGAVAWDQRGHPKEGGGTGKDIFSPSDIAIAPLDGHPTWMPSLHHYDDGGGKKNRAPLRTFGIKISQTSGSNFD